jgi:hypothetical protein
MLADIRWVLRTTLMFFAGVIPAILLFLYILVVLPLAATLPALVDWLAVLAVLALLGIGGLWTATFRDARERILPNAVTISLVLCGLLAAVPVLIGMALEAGGDGELSPVLTLCLLGPVICAIYFLIEQFALALRGRSATPRRLPSEHA